MSSYHILSIDGGGILGVVACVILQRLEAAHLWFLDQVDLFAGTSTKTIVALGLAIGRTPTQVRELYEAVACKVFTCPRRRPVPRWAFWRGRNRVAISCPHCRAWSRVPDSALGHRDPMP
jgi:patatin-like phospholipase/acyl hydrolase